MSDFQVGRQFVDEVGNAQYQTGQLFVNDNAATIYELTATNTLEVMQFARHQFYERGSAWGFIESFQNGEMYFNGAGGHAYQAGMFYYYESGSNPNLLFLSQLAVAEVVPSQRIGLSTLTLDHEALAVVARNRTATSALSLTQSAESGLLTRSAYNSLDLTQFAHFEQELEVTASSELDLTQSAKSHLLTRSAYSSLELEQEVDMFTQDADAIALTAESTLSLTQTNNRFILFADAIQLDAESVLTLTHRAFFPIELEADNTLVLTQLALAELGKSAESILELDHSASVLAIRNITASHTLDLNQSVLWLHYRDGVVITDSGCGVTQRYYPFVGEGPMPIRATPPPLVKQDDVLFFYPAGPICAATTSFTLRTPNFGDRDRNQYNRINRETRGGTLQVFRDPQWPKQRTLMMDFTGVKDDEVDGILAFLEGTLGVKVGFRDWEGRVWNGIIMTPDAPIIRNNRNRSDIALELEVDDTELQVTGCSSLVFTQGADAVVDP